MKKTPNFVLGRSDPSTYMQEYASGPSLIAASLAGLFDQPAADLGH